MASERTSQSASPARGASVADASLKSATEERVSAESIARTILNEVKVDTRIIIRTANMRIGVEDADRAVKDAKEITNKVGGYTDGDNLSGPPEIRTGSLTLRVPVGKFEDVLDQLNQLGVPISQSSNADDVTDRMVDLTARLRSMRAEELQYLEIMRQANKITDILAVRDRLASVRQEIESLDATLTNMSKQAAYSTIHVEFVPSPLLNAGTQENWAKRSFVGATDSLFGFARGIASAGIRILVFAPVWLPVILLFVWARGRWFKSGEKPVTTSPSHPS
ncbi:MAG: DUF4349 domain-containing protein [Fimbriimonadaceae bacterium]|nr:DUF4349 domain-containing protein [Fimbriimonadaceae bacterium]